MFNKCQPFMEYRNDWSAMDVYTLYMGDQRSI